MNPPVHPLDSPLTMINAVMFVFCIFMGAYLWGKGRKDIAIQVMREAIHSLEEIAEKHEFRIQQNENNVTRLIALQESMERHLGSIDRRHERVDDTKHEKERRNH